MKCIHSFKAKKNYNVCARLYFFSFTSRTCTNRLQNIYLITWHEQYTKKSPLVLKTCMTASLKPCPINFYHEKTVSCFKVDFVQLQLSIAGSNYLL